MKYLLSCLLLLFSVSSQALNSGDFKAIDSAVAAIGPLEGAPLFTIVKRITEPATSETESMRAIYDWVIFNIGFDCAGYHHQSQRKTNVGEILNARLATSDGYALLIQAMCDRARIECHTVQGYEKSNEHEIGKPRKKLNYTWNVVKIDNTLYIIDATAGAGFTDKRKKNFTARATDVYFYARRQAYALNHIPVQRKWQLLDTPVTKTQLNTGVLAYAGYLAAVEQVNYMRGTFRARTGNCKRVEIDIKNDVAPPSPGAVSVWNSKTKQKEQVDCYIVGRKAYVDIPFRKKGRYYMKIYFGNEPICAYKAEVKKKKR